MSLRVIVVLMISCLALAGCFHAESDILAESGAPCPVAEPTVYSRSQIDAGGETYEQPYARISPNGVECIVESVDPDATGFAISIHVIIKTHPLGEGWHLVQMRHSSFEDVDLGLIRLSEDRLEVYNPSCSDFLPDARTQFGLDSRCFVPTLAQAEAVMRAVSKLNRQPNQVYLHAPPPAADLKTPGP